MLRLSLGEVPPARPAHVEELRGRGGAATTVHRRHAPFRPTAPGSPADAPAAFHRDDAGDLLVHVRRGAGKLRTMLGPVLFGPEDFLVVPRGVTHRFEPDPAEPEQAWVCLHVPDGVAVPPGCDRRGPLQLETHDAVGEFALTVRDAGGVWLHTLPHHPFDVLGWEGAVFPYTVDPDDVGPDPATAFGVDAARWRDAQARLAR